MNIALIGYGNMGLEIARLVEEKQTDRIVSISYGENNNKLDIAGIKKADVVIDFTSPEIVIDNIKQLAVLKKPIVVGTTGWYDQIDFVKELVVKNNIGFVYGQNFSIGANIFFKIVEFGSKIINSFDAYDVYGSEVHHVGKKDSPSGTAKKLSQIILQNFSSKKIVQEDSLKRKIQKDELHFTSIRAGRNPGRHDIIFDSFADQINLSHQAHNRRGFAEGALMAARFIQNKKGFYRFDDVFQEVTQQ